MQHAGQGHVVHEAGTAVHLVGDVEPCRSGAGQRALDRRLGCDAGRGLALEQAVLGQLPVAGAQVARAGDGAVPHLQALRGHPQPLARRVQEGGARLRAGIAQRHAGMLDGIAARGHPLVGAGGRAGRHHAHARDVDIELVGDDLGNGGQDALPDLDLAGKYLHDPFWAEAQPLRQALVALQAARQRASAGIQNVVAETGPSAHRLCACALLGGPQHGANDAIVRSAATQVAVESVAHLALAGVGVALQQRGGRDQDARNAVAALHRLLGDERRLQPMRLVRCAEPLHGHDILAGGSPQRGVAGGHRLTVDQHIAGAALVGAAAEMRRHQTQGAAQHAEQRRCRVGLHGVLRPVDAQPYRLGHGRYCVLMPAV